MPRFPSAQGRLNHEPGFHLSCDENLSEGWGPPLLDSPGAEATRSFPRPIRFPEEPANVQAFSSEFTVDDGEAIALPWND